MTLSLSEQLTLYDNKLNPKQKEIFHLFLQGKSDREIADQEELHRTTVTKHLTNVAKKMGVPPEFEPDYRCLLIETFAKIKPELVSPKALEKCGLLNQNIRYPDNPEPLTSPFYQVRDPWESQCYQALHELGSLIRIKSPKKMGKTSLLKRIIAHAKERNYQTVYLNFSLVEKEKLTNYEQFLLSFYEYLNIQLSLNFTWETHNPSMVNCTNQMQKLLKKINGVLVLVLDEVDQLFNYPQIYRDFFSMLRNWHENGSESETWENLRIVVAHSTQDYGKLDINKSPFNVGIPIKLEEFNHEQIKKLAMLHGIDSKIIEPITALVGGHPFLIRLAFYHLANQNLSVNQLIEELTTDSGIYSQHLRECLALIEDKIELADTLKEVLSSATGINPQKLNQKYRYQLEGIGLVKIKNNSVVSSCLLYQQYFQKILF